MISHAEAQALTSARLDGALDPVAERELVVHLATCASCRAFAEQSNALVSGLRELPYLPASPTVSRAVHAYIDKPRSPWAKLGTIVPIQGMQAFSAVAAALIVVLFSVFVYTRVDRTNTPLDPGTDETVTTEIGGILEASTATVPADVTEGADQDAENGPVETAEPDEPTEQGADDQAEPTSESGFSDDAVNGDDSVESTTEPDTTAADDPDGSERVVAPTEVPSEEDPTEIAATTEPEGPTETAETDVTGQSEPTEDSVPFSLLPTDGTPFDSTEVPAPTETPVPTDFPTETAEPSVAPTDEPTETPVPTDEPTETPVPTDEPTVVPTDEPTETPVPTDEPTETPIPTDEPTVVPTDEPTETPVPTDEPTETPVPTDEPTETPIPTDEPTVVPTDEPTETPVPTDEPTVVPTDEPTETPVPTDEPTETPVPTDEPTETPVPTDEPTETPIPTDEPTETPVPTETLEPTATPEPTEDDDSPGIQPIDGTFATTDEDPDAQESPEDATETPEDLGTDVEPTEVVDIEATVAESPEAEVIEPIDGTTEEIDEPTEEPADPTEEIEESAEPTEEVIEGGDNQIQPIDGEDDGTGGGDDTDEIETPVDETNPDGTEETGDTETDEQTNLSDVAITEQFSAVSGDLSGRLAIASNGDLVLDSNLDVVSTANSNGLTLEQTETESGVYVAVCDQNGNCVSSEPIDPADPSDPVLETPIGWLGNSAIYERIQGDTVSFRTFQIDSDSGELFGGVELISGGREIESTQNGAYFASDGILIPGTGSWVFLSTGGNSQILGSNPYGQISLVRTGHADGQITYVGDGQLVQADLSDPGDAQTAITIGLVDYDLAPSGDRFVISTGTEILIVDFSGNVLVTYFADAGSQIGSVLWLNSGIAYVDLSTGSINLIPQDNLP